MAAPSQQEITLRITDDRLNHWDCKKFVNRPLARNASASAFCDNDSKHACWTYILCRTDNQLRVLDVKLMNNQIRSEFKWAHIVPHKPQQKGKEYKCAYVRQVNDSMLLCLDAAVIINESAFLDKSNPTRYAFDLVFSTSQVLSPECRNVIKEPPKAIKESPKASEESPRVNESEKSLKELSPEKYQDLLALLCDFRTVDVAFVFTIYECNARVALWAHRVMLDRHPRFRELFKSHQDSVSADGPLMVLVEGIALTTFCALLKYLYTDDLGLTIDPEQFLVCSMGDLEEVHSSGDKHVASAVLTKTLRELNASQFHASWEVKDKVTWADLFLAADRFEIPKLRQQCLKNLLGSVEKSNAMEILFGVGQHFKAEIRDPVMKYISEHLDDVFSIQTEDPFKRFSGYAGYHEMMLELLRVSRSK